MPKFTGAGYMKVAARFTREEGDVVTNNFVFAIGSGDRDDIRDRLDLFYWGLAGTQTATLAEFMSSRLVDLTYYMRPADAAVGFPGVEVPSLLWNPGGASADLPPDVAVCLSLRSGPPYTARRRGRIYLGPLRKSACTDDGLVAETFRAAISEAGRGLASISATNPVRWVIASAVGNSAASILEGYVDNHFDTIRSRDPGTETFGRHASDWTLAELP